MALAIVAIWLSGISTYSKGVAALRRGQLNMNALMGVAVTGAFLIGQWPEAAMVMALYAIAELIEARSVDRAQRHQGAARPDAGHGEVRQADGSWREEMAAEVRLVLRSGQARRPHTAGWPSNGGQQCGQSGAGHRRKHSGGQGGGRSRLCRHHQRNRHLEFVTAAATTPRWPASSTPSNRPRARERRPNASWTALPLYTPAMFAIAVAVAVLAPGCSVDLDAGALQGAGAAGHCLPLRAGHRHAGYGRQRLAAARRGILIKGGVYLEEARKLRAIALDKTGTITEGKPRLVATEVLMATEPESGFARGQPGRPFGPSGLEGHCNRPSFRKTA
jgi:Cd2+/Zn2+-exporting ATPase